MLRLWFVPAVVEAVLGLALLFGRSQKWAAIGLVGMHALLLLLLGPLGRDANSSVWPWNIGNALLLVLLFVAWPAPKLRLGRTPASWIAALALGAAPALNLLDLWPAYLSANLYSGNIYQGFVLLSEERAVTAPDGLGKELRPYQGKLSANLSTWSRRVQNVPAFPEAWALRRIASALCRSGDPPDAIEMVLMKRPGLSGPLRRPVRFDCCRRD